MNIILQVIILIICINKMGNIKNQLSQFRYKTVSQRPKRQQNSYCVTLKKLPLKSNANPCRECYY